MTLDNVSVLSQTDYFDLRDNFIKKSENEPLKDGIINVSLAHEDGTRDSVAIGYGYDLKQNSVSTVENDFLGIGITLSTADLSALASFQSGALTKAGFIAAWSGIPITEAQASQLLQNRLARVEEAALSSQLGLNDLPFSAERAAVIDIFYNYGTGGAPSSIRILNQNHADFESKVVQRAELWWEFAYNSVALSNDPAVLRGLQERRIENAEMIAITGFNNLEEALIVFEWLFEKDKGSFHQYNIDRHFDPQVSLDVIEDQYKPVFDVVNQAFSFGIQIDSYQEVFFDSKVNGGSGLGDADNNLIFYLDGDDSVQGDISSDFVHGGEENTADLISYSNATVGVSVSVDSTKVVDGLQVVTIDSQDGAWVDHIVDFEAIELTNLDDTVDAPVFNNLINGLGGNDTFALVLNGNELAGNTLSIDGGAEEDAVTFANQSQDDLTLAFNLPDSETGGETSSIQASMSLASASDLLAFNLPDSETGGETSSIQASMSLASASDLLAVENVERFSVESSGATIATADFSQITGTETTSFLIETGVAGSQISYGDGAIVLDGFDVLVTTETDDLVSVETNNARIDGGSGDDEFLISGTGGVFIGSEGDDRFTIDRDELGSGQASRTIIWGGEGQDVIDLSSASLGLTPSEGIEIFIVNEEDFTSEDILGLRGSHIDTVLDAFNAPDTGFSAFGNNAVFVINPDASDRILVDGVSVDFGQYYTFMNGIQSYSGNQNAGAPLGLDGFGTGYGNNGFYFYTDGFHYELVAGDFLSRNFDHRVNIYGYSAGDFDINPVGHGTPPATLEISLLNGEVENLELAPEGAGAFRYPYARPPGEEDAVTRLGSVDDDNFSGSEADDIIYGFAGDDVIDTGSGDDLAFGQEGNDSLTGGAGDDSIEGGTGDDTLIGGAGNDALLGGSGHDIAIFDGSFEEYLVTVNSEGSYTVFSDRDDDAGTDELTEIEALQFDDGTLSGDTFTPNNSQVTVFDEDGTKAWTQYTDTFNADGIRISRDMDFDDGRIAQTTYENGVRAEAFTTDAADVFVWSTQQRSFDGAGELISLTTIFDDGREKLDTYSAGTQLEQTIVDLEDAFNWTRIEKQFDASGDLLEKFVSYDDGREAVTNYESGQKTQTVFSDLDDAFSWTTIEQSFDVNGDRDESITLYDDGRELTVDYVEGTKSSAVMLDLGDEYNWVSHTDRFNDDGFRFERTTIFDDGREVVRFFDDPNIA